MSIGSSIYQLENDLNRKSSACKVNDGTAAELNRLLRQKLHVSLSDQKTVLTLLDQLFESLLAQADSPLEREFIAELHDLCRERLTSEQAFKLSLTSSELDSWSKNRIAYTSEVNSFWMVILKILTIFKRRLLKERVALGQRGRTDLTVDSGFVIFLATVALNSALERAGILEKLSQCFSTRLKVVGAALEISAAGSTWWKASNEDSGGIDTDYSHYDEAIEHPKAIVYLSDVGVDAGPTEYFPGLFEVLELTPLQELVSRVVLNVGSDPRSSIYPHFQGFEQRSASPVFRDLFSRLPEQMRFNSHFGWDVPHTHPLRQEFRDRRIQVTGRSGTVLVFDGGRVVHRGGLIQRGERVVFQVVFGLADGGIMRYALSRFRRP